jgi:hypothetical protein
VAFATANVNTKVLLLVGFLCAATELARADYLWTWHGFLYDFQGSFEVPDAEIQPGVDFGSTSPLFFNSISITSTVENVTYQYSTASYAAAAGYFSGSGPNDYVLMFDFNDNASQTGVSYYGATGTMTEHIFSNGGAFGERGYWSYAYKRVVNGSVPSINGSVPSNIVLTMEGGEL